MQKARLHRAVQLYSGTVYKIAMVILRNPEDADDAYQETFLRYFKHAPEFESAEHEKAWLITVATNKCKDLLRFRARHPMIDLEQIQEFTAEDSDSGILEALMTLPEKFRIVLILYYVEEYRIEEIAKVIGKTPSAVKMRLQKGRSLLEKVYRKEYM